MINYYHPECLTKPDICKQLLSKVLQLAYYNCPLDSEFQDSWRECNYILYVVSGTKKLHTKSCCWQLRSGSVLFVKKGTCSLENIAGDELCLVVFFITDTYLCNFLKQNNNLLHKERLCKYDNECIIPLEANEVMVTYFKSVLPCFYLSKKPSEKLLDLKFNELLFNIIPNPANYKFHYFLQILALQESNNIQPVIEANCYRNLPLNDFAKLCNRSLSSFKRDFKKVYNAAPARWLLNKRLNYAMHLLTHSDKTISKISFESGFENSSHFSRVFKNRFGLSPQIYRHQSNFNLA